MGTSRKIILLLLIPAMLVSFVHGEQSSVKTEVVSISLEMQHESLRAGSESAVAVRFEPEENWHFYASEENAPGGMNLKLVAGDVNGISFGEPVYPKSHRYEDEALGETVDVFSGDFTVYLPFRVEEDVEEGDKKISIEVQGAICSEMQCRMPDFGMLSGELRISEEMSEAAFEVPLQDGSGQDKEGPAAMGFSIWFALVLAFVAGLLLIVMPCVWPVLPIIVMRIVDQSKGGKGKSLAMGFMFSAGILLFFAALAILNIVLQVFYGTVLQWGDQFRSPAVIAGMSLLLIALALFMFGLFTISLPSSVAGKAGQGKGYAGSVGMGFLAAVLSTPCSFGILAAAFAWAQAQPLLPATLVIMTIGVGMSVPFLFLTAVPRWLEKLPRGGAWMEYIKEGIGFLLLLIAVKLMTALPEDMLYGVMYFSVVLAFAVWMWGKWVTFSTPGLKKWVIRILALAIAVFGWYVFMTPAAASKIDWSDYDEVMIEEAIENGRPVIIKFTADWCMSCKVVEVSVYGDEEVQELIEEKDVLMVKADTTEKGTAATIAHKEKYQEPGVPVSLLFLPGEDEPIRYREIFFGEELKEKLEGI